ncbi:EscT/YscT/HrcT family type III secretion system export apparatus protein (plasmid) [Rhizobium leguminosarum]|uniref:type III secretion system export apparatus subunit SctT n=1 Tax=Rhizobium leguminosarum TaxID=384 RepID=UPI0010318FCF|nr:type III secretion system export apparatus subunit SctT [Rhizobium leguminosarum]MBY5378381.1 type III secretion system export apparatus subunit SctT [Rhizobium leguminosarum]TBF35129.1 EscT/YscT/HrcT family type III secretion system export apparatus protein [Rhizobium leguminosarum]TBF87971.1 EscT/YscT/HrcT family type III secretion system export apparatus protein [Rhizobium leguminosarum]
MNLGPAVAALTDFAYPLLVAAAIAVARALGMIMLTPAFVRLGLTGMIRSAVAFAISLPMIFPIFQQLAVRGQPTSFDLTGLLLKEMVIGALIGLVFGIPFWAAEVAGDLVDLQRGSTMSQLVDPLGAGESSITATLLTITLLAMFFMTGGFTLLLGGFYRSYEIWPAASFVPVLNASAFTGILHILDRIMQIGVLIIAPLVIAILMADVMMAFLSRMAPQLHVFDLSMAVKNLFFSFLMVLYISFLVPLLLDQLRESHGTFEILRGFVSNSEAMR